MVRFKSVKMARLWTDLVTVGDGVANETRDDSLTDGWTHDSKMPGNRYIEGELASPVKPIISVFYLQLTMMLVL